MCKKLMILVMVLFLSSTCVWAVDIGGGINMPDTLKAGNSSLVFNGAGFRKKFGLKVYGVALYLKAKSADGSALVKGDEPMALRMTWKMNIPASKIDETYYESFADVLKAPKQDQYTAKSNYGPMTKDVVTFMGWIDKKEASKNNSFIYIYTPGKGTEVHLVDGGKDQLM
nr:chalcone isomerase family protein [Desulfobacteraceae bacterium]